MKIWCFFAHNSCTYTQSHELFMHNYPTKQIDEARHDSENRDAVDLVDDAEASHEAVKEEVPEHGLECTACQNFYDGRLVASQNCHMVSGRQGGGRSRVACDG
ncbi:unnamed protein product [Protopolystoma xenopodis]|uniref:Uncharacterized protein n=1 Tax=Protopolystoma xenopodis TaxID=117903 RepID=A0A448XM57_9PLAT|nr:unnamed protein product [Protopolystoma xenopodis]